MSGEGLPELLDSFQDLIDVQTTPGNVGAGEYMRGMANGMILAQYHFSRGERCAIDAEPDSDGYRQTGPAYLGPGDR